MSLEKRHSSVYGTISQINIQDSSKVIISDENLEIRKLFCLIFEKMKKLPLKKNNHHHKIFAVTLQVDL